MYKAVVIDDEPIIVKGLSRLIPWEELGCTLAGTAGDGLEALELIRKVRPDLVITDIYMPRMDGLVMIAALKSEFEDIEISILTGYRDFDLAQKALNLGVTRFLLKPSNLDELVEAVRVMTEKLKKKGISSGSDRTKDPESGTGSVHTAECIPSAEPPQVSGGSCETGKERPEQRFLVNAALAYMEENYDRKLMLQEVADHVYVSQWHLSKLLNQYAGKPFNELLNTLRIKKAKELLDDPAYRITDISDMTGFQDVAHFSRVFKKLTGVSAYQYRNGIRQ